MAFVDRVSMMMRYMCTDKPLKGLDEWELIPVGHNIPPALILEDVARVYRDIGDQWRALTWWLSRVHESSGLSTMLMLRYANHVLVLENDYVNLGRRPHGLLELVCGGDSHLFLRFFRSGLTGPYYKLSWNPSHTVTTLEWV